MWFICFWGLAPQRLGQRSASEDRSHGELTPLTLYKPCSSLRTASPHCRWDVFTMPQRQKRFLPKTEATLHSFVRFVSGWVAGGGHRSALTEASNDPRTDAWETDILHTFACVCVCMYLLYKLYLDSRLGDTQSRPVQVKTIGQARQSIYSGTVGSWHKHPCLIMFVLTACVQHWILQYCSSSWRNTCLDPKNFNGLTWRQSCSIKMLMFPKNQRKKGLHWLHERVVASSTERLAKRDPQNVVSMGIDSTNELCDRVSWLCRTWLARAWMNAEVFTTKIGLLLAEAVWWSRESQAFSVLSKCVLPQ